MNDKHAKQFWRSNLRLMAGYLSIWAMSSFGIGIVWKDFFDRFYIDRAPLGFWFSQQGAIIVFVIIIFAYCFHLNKLEDKYLNLDKADRS